jgi:tetratricopeptide (TPR) repeat protein/CHAT domain-containing protein
MADLKLLTELFKSAWETNDFASALRHATAAALLCEGLDEASSERRRADWNLASAYYASGDLVQAERLYLSLLEAERRVLGPRHTSVAATLGELGTLYTTIGDYERAETFLREAREIQQEVRGPKHLRVGIILNALGLLYTRKGDLEPAASYLEAALAVFRDAGAAGRLATAHLNLAEVYRSLGDLDKAEPICRQAVSDLRSTLREGDPRIALAENNLALIAFDRGQPLEARAGFYRALEEIRKGRGARLPDFPLILQNIAKTYEATGDAQRAGRFLERALRLQVSTLGEDHPATALMRINLGQLLSKDAKTAKPHFLRAYRSLRRAVGIMHPWVAFSLSGLAAGYLQEESFPQASVLYQKSEAILRSLFGDKHPEVAQNLRNRGVLLKEMGDRAGALPLWAEALTIYEEHDLQRHLRYLEALYLLEESCSKLRRLPEAEVHLAKAMALTQEILVPEHPLFLQVIIESVEVYASLEKLPEAEALLQRALDICRSSIGEDHSVFAECLEQMAGVQSLLGRILDAQELLFRALQVRRRCSGETSFDVALDLQNLGNLYKILADHDRAENFYVQALAIRRDLFGYDCLSSPGLLSGLADVSIARGDYDRARELQSQALEIRRTWFGEQSSEVAKSYHDMAHLECSRGNYPQAERLYERAIGLSSEEDGFYFEAWQGLAQVRFELGDYERAEDDIRRALMESAPSVVSHASSLNFLGTILTAKGKYLEAESSLTSALELQVSALGRQHPQCAATISNLAVLYYTLGRFARAESFHRESVQIGRVVFGNRHPDLARALNNLAALLQMKGEFREADVLLHEALEIWRVANGERSVIYATGLANLGILQFAIEQSKKADILLSRALAIVQAISEEHPICAQILSFLESLGELATLLYFQGRTAEAETLYRQVVDTLERIGSDRHPAYGLALGNLGLLLMEKGPREDAEALVHRSLEVLGEIMGRRNFLYAGGLLLLALFLFEEGRRQEGLECLETAEGLQDELIEQVFGIGSEAVRSDYLKRVRTSFEIFLTLAADSSSRAFDLVLRRKGLGTEALAIQSTALLAGRRPDLEPVLRKLVEVRDQIGRRILTGPGPEGLEEHEKLVSRWQEERENLEAQIAREIPETGLEGSFKRAYRQEIAAALPDGSALVELVRHDRYECRKAMKLKWGAARYIAFLMRSGEPDSVVVIDLSDARPIENALFDFRAAILRGARTRELDEELLRIAPEEELHRSGNELRSLVFDPLAMVLAGCRHLLIAPDYRLAWLPFEVLPLSDGRYLSDEFQISYLGTGRDILRWGESGITPGEAVVIADPDFDLVVKATKPEPESLPLGPIYELQQDHRRFERLKGTRREGQFIAKRLGVSPWVGKAAREGRLKSVQSPWILHIATHGFFLRDPKRFEATPDLGKPLRPTRAGELRLGDAPRAENPLLRSGLVLAGANSRLAGRLLPVDAEDGLLTAEDVTGLNLQGTEMVVLSACETGLGEPLAGEAIMGLRRSFTIAGARTLVMSLWPVPDKETQELMEDFYRRVLDGVPRAEALRQAQRAMRARPDRSHPFYWGAFICQGDPGPLTFPSPPSGST